MFRTIVVSVGNLVRIAGGNVLRFFTEKKKGMTEVQKETKPLTVEEKHVAFGDDKNEFSDTFINEDVVAKQTVQTDEDVKDEVVGDVLRTVEEEVTEDTEAPEEVSSDDAKEAELDRLYDLHKQYMVALSKLGELDTDISTPFYQSLIGNMKNTAKAIRIIEGIEE